MAKGKASGFSVRDEAANDGAGEQAATLTEIGFVQEFTYGGRYKDRPSAALRTVFTIPGMQRPWEDHWPLGPSDKFEVSKDGYSITPTSEKTSGLSRKSGAYFFFNALETALAAQGLDIGDYVTETDGGVSVEALEGLDVILENKAFATVSGDTKDKKVIGSIVLDAPKGRGARPTASTGANGSGAGTRGNGSGKIEAKTAAAIRELLDDKTSVKAADLANYVFQGNRKDPDAKAMMNLCFKDSFLAGLDGIELKKGVLRLAEGD